MNAGRLRSQRGPREISRKELLRGKALRFEVIAWRDAEGKRRLWETAERVIRKPAVLMIPWLMPSRRLLLIRQYRPPARGMVIEFPAGLIDREESVRATALRELYEETGYRGRIVRMTPPTCNTPGLSGETVCQFLVEIDERRPANRNARPRPDAGEHIEVVLVPVRQLQAFLRRELRAGTRFDSKVMAYLLGMGIRA